MRLVTLRTATGPRPAAVLGDEVADAGGAAASVLEIVQGSPDALRAVAEETARSARIPLEGADLGPPLRPGNVFCVGWNYMKHFEEGAARRDEELPEHPAFFSKASTSVIGPYDPIPSHAGVTSSLDWEAELGVVIGAHARDVSTRDALIHVAGYLVGDDISARDLQRRHGGQWLKGKSLDGTCPLGPWLVTADEIDDPGDLEVYSSVNGTPKQRASTASMIFPVAELISRLSEGMTLLPGDVLLTGTPEGVGMGRTPPEYLGAGDVVTCGVEGIGEIVNRVV